MNNIKLIGIVVIWHLVIFLQSFLPGDLSSNQSGIIVNFVYPIIQSIGLNIDIETTSFLIRKLAHMVEFAILGIFLFYLYKYKFNQKKLLFVLMFHGLLVAVIDETIQSFIPNRAGQVLDVLIDFVGFSIGITGIWLLNKYIINKKQINKV